MVDLQVLKPKLVQQVTVIIHGSEQKDTMENDGGPPVAKASPEFLWYELHTYIVIVNT